MSNPKVIPFSHFPQFSGPNARSVANPLNLLRPMQWNPNESWNPRPLSHAANAFVPPPNLQQAAHFPRPLSHAANAFVPPPNLQQVVDREQGVRCHICRNLGHKKRNCPYRQIPAREPNNAASRRASRRASIRASRGGRKKRTKQTKQRR